MCLKCSVQVFLFSFDIIRLNIFILYNIDADEYFGTVTHKILNKVQLIEFSKCREGYYFVLNFTINVQLKH